jgi:hypothetical protein
LQKDYDDDSRRLNELKKKMVQMGEEHNNINDNRERLDGDIGE